MAAAAWNRPAPSPSVTPVSTVAGSEDMVPRSAPDLFMRRLLRVPQVRPTRRANEAAERLFSVSILLSATRCLLSYVVFPFLLVPVLGVAGLLKAVVGIPVGLLALVFDVRGIRRFFVADHRWRWPITALYVAVMILVVILVVSDTASVLR